MSSITEDSLRFAQSHIRSFYASDFFPDADEFEAVWAGWDQVTAHYKTADVTRLGTTPEDMACAKASGGFRLVHQLQPLDTLTYTALAYLIAPHLEEKRIPDDEGVACSYRLAPQVSGELFKADADGYSTFRQRSGDLSQLRSWVLVADIAGFYNHIYVHRVEGAVQALDRSLASAASELHEFLLNLNDRVSIGIPVGPAASVVVAELILNDVDQFLRAHRVRPLYTRYVDDYRFFSDSRSDLEEVWHDLAAFLYRSQRLTLANAKCRIMSATEFRDTVLMPPTNTKRADLAKTLGISFADFEIQYPSDDSTFAATAAPKPEEEAKRAALEQLMEELLSDDELNIGLARQLLRRARVLRMRCISRPVITHLGRLAPVVRDAVLYLNAVLNAKSISHNAQFLERFLTANATFVRTSHLHYWTASLLSGKRDAAELRGYNAFIESALPRFRARSARVLDRPAWVRDNRAEWQRWATWDRWSLLHAAELLPAAERRAWMDSVSRSPDLMDRLIAAKVRAL